MDWDERGLGASILNLLTWLLRCVHGILVQVSSFSCAVMLFWGPLDGAHKDEGIYAPIWSDIQSSVSVALNSCASIEC